MIPPRAALLERLTPFDPARGNIDTDWMALADLAESNGLAPLVSYNLEYRLGGAGAPQEVRDRLLALYQGTLNDNVFKLVTLKRVLAEAEDLPVMLLGAVSVADCAYPHVAFRPVPEVHLGIKGGDQARVPALFAKGGLHPDPAIPGAFTDNRARFVVASSLTRSVAADAAFWERSLPADAYGRSVRRPSLEDAILLLVESMSREAFRVPLIQFVDLRELIQGAPATGALYDAPASADVLLPRAAQAGLSRSLYCALTVAAQLFPKQRSVFSSLQPHLGLAARALVDRLIVGPAVENAGGEATTAPSALGKALLDG